jgi:methylmalonyl-CoA mutase C-terminal domain/subunit
MSTAALRLLVGKVGLDGHDRGAKIVARALRDSGCEVIYTGLHQTPEMVVNAAIQEDVDAICLSILSGAHNTLLPRVLGLLEEKGASDIPLVAGGIIPDEDIDTLKKAGVVEVFTPGTSTQEIVDFVRARVQHRRGAVDR